MPGSDERKQLEGTLKCFSENVEEIPIVIGCSELKTKDVRYQVMPHNHSHKIAKFYYADKVSTHVGAFIFFQYENYFW